MLGLESIAWTDAGNTLLKEGRPYQTFRCMRASGALAQIQPAPNMLTADSLEPKIPQLTERARCVEPDKHGVSFVPSEGNVRVGFEVEGFLSIDYELQ